MQVYTFIDGEGTERVVRTDHGIGAARLAVKRYVEDQTGSVAAAEIAMRTVETDARSERERYEERAH